MRSSVSCECGQVVTGEPERVAEVVRSYEKVFQNTSCKSCEEMHALSPMKICGVCRGVRAFTLRLRFV